jgi:hypothetical protein
MKYFLCLVMMVALMPATSRSQAVYRKGVGGEDSVLVLKKEPKFSVNIHSGYSLALGSTFAFYPDDITRIQVEGVNNSIGSKKINYQAPTKGLGEGFRIGAGFSYILNDFINIGLDIDYFRSTIRKIRDSISHQVFTAGSPDETLFQQRNTVSYDAILLTFSPNITFKAISRPKWFIYNKVGAVIVLRPNSIEHDITDVHVQSTWSGYVKDSSGHSDLQYDWGIRNPSLGFMGGIGIQIKLREQIRFFYEIQFSHVVFQIKDRMLTKYEVNGQDMSASLPMSQREIYFKKDYQTSGQAQDPNQPGEATVQRLPITYVGLQAGLVYRF